MRLSRTPYFLKMKWMCASRWEGSESLSRGRGSTSRRGSGRHTPGRLVDLDRDSVTSGRLIAVQSERAELERGEIEGTHEVPALGHSGFASDVVEDFTVLVGWCRFGLR